MRTLVLPIVRTKVLTTNSSDRKLEETEFFRACDRYPETQISEKIQEIELEFLKEDLPKMLNSMKIGVERISKTATSSLLLCGAVKPGISQHSQQCDRRSRKTATTSDDLNSHRTKKSSVEC